MIQGTNQPLQNRVDPYGRIIAHPSRGMLMGNRGCLHDDSKRIVRESARDAWISCVTAYDGIRRVLMQPGHYTELFFLDEATAMAAGHRPCGSCRPEQLHAFKQAWATAFALSDLPRVATIDAALRDATPMNIDAAAVPDGGLVQHAGEVLLRWKGRWLTWSFNGYRPSAAAPGRSLSLTSEPMLAVLRAGYVPMVHPTALIRASDGSRAAVANAQRAQKVCALGAPG